MKGMYLGRRFYRQMFGLVLVMILAPEGLAAQDAIATALDRIHREYSSGPMDTARLVLLDRELRELIPHYSWQERPWLRATYLKVVTRASVSTPGYSSGTSLFTPGSYLLKLIQTIPIHRFEVILCIQRSSGVKGGVQLTCRRLMPQRHT